MNKTVKQFLSSKLNLVRFSAQVFVMGTIISLTFFLLAIDFLKSYRSEILILVNAKSELAEKQSGKFVANIVELPKTLAFYDRLLKFNPDVRDVTAEMSADQRKQKWNEMFSISEVNENVSIFKISITAKRENDAQQLASKSARTLFDTVAFYYDIENDFDLRIIDGPISKSQVPAWYALILVSVVGGFAFATSLNFFFLAGRKSLIAGADSLRKNSLFDFKRESKITPEKEIESLNNLYQAEQMESPFVFEEKSDEQEISKESFEKTPQVDPAFQEIKQITKKFESNKYPNFAEMPFEKKQEAVAPDNLPIAGDTFFEYEIQEEVADPQSAPVVIEEAPIVDTKKEPTPEELKKRLNQLLRGEF